MPAGQHLERDAAGRRHDARRGRCRVVPARVDRDDDRTRAAVASVPTSSARRGARWQSLPRRRGDPDRVCPPGRRQRRSPRARWSSPERSDGASRPAAGCRSRGVIRRSSCSDACVRGSAVRTSVTMRSRLHLCAERYRTRHGIPSGSNLRPCMGPALRQDAPSHAW
jgi:hypothetical protein